MLHWEYCSMKLALIHWLVGLSVWLFLLLRFCCCCCLRYIIWRTELLRERETDFPPNGLLPTWLQQSGLGQPGASTLRCAQESKHLEYLPQFSQTHQEGAGLEVDYPALQLKAICNATSMLNPGLLIFTMSTKWTNRNPPWWLPPSCDEHLILYLVYH